MRGQRKSPGPFCLPPYMIWFVTRHVTHKNKYCSKTDWLKFDLLTDCSSTETHL